MKLHELAQSEEPGYVKQPGSRGRRVNLDSQFQRKLWDNALTACLGDIGGKYVGILGDWDTEFVRDMERNTKERDAGECWNPTVKQFEYLRELARRLDEYG